MPLTDEMRKLYRVENNQVLGEGHYLMHGALEGIIDNPSVGDEGIKGVVAILTGEAGFFDVRNAGEGRDYFVAYVHQLPYLVLADSHTYSEESLDRPVFLVEGISLEDDLLCLEEAGANPLLVRSITALLNDCLGQTLEIPEGENSIQ